MDKILSFLHKISCLGINMKASYLLESASSTCTQPNKYEKMTLSLQQCSRGYPDLLIFDNYKHNTICWLGWGNFWQYQLFIFTIREISIRHSGLDQKRLTEPLFSFGCYKIYLNWFNCLCAAPFFRFREKKVIFCIQKSGQFFSFVLFLKCALSCI